MSEKKSEKNIEELLLSCILSDTSILDEVYRILKTDEVFEDERHRLLFRSLMEMANNEGGVITLPRYIEYATQKSILDGIGGIEYLYEIYGAYNNPADFFEFATALKANFVKRRIRSLSRSVIKNIDKKPPEELLSVLEREVSSLSDDALRQESRLVAEEVHGVLEDYDRVRSDVRLMGIPSGYKSLDDIILGWSPGDLVVIGNYAHPDNGIDAGSAFLYKYDGSTWVEQSELLPADGTAGDHYGRSVALSGNSIVVGAYFDDQGGLEAGSAYFFDITCTAPCPADLTGDGILNFFDVSAFLGAFAAQNPDADFNGDGSYNFFDVSAFLGAFSVGCP